MNNSQSIVSWSLDIHTKVTHFKAWPCASLTLQHSQMLILKAQAGLNMKGKQTILLVQAAWG